VFDAVGTLIHPEPAAAVVYAEIGRRWGSQLPVSTILPRFAAAFQMEEAQDHKLNLRTSEEREQQRWRGIVGKVLDDVSDSERCFQELYEHFSKPEAWRLDPEAAETINRLARLGYILGMASNYDHRLRQVAAGLPPLNHLQHLVISSEVGWRKPALQFFWAVCQSVGLPAAQILYVGDDLLNDCRGAQLANLRSVWFDSKQLVPVGLLSCIHRLGELPKLVRTMSKRGP
jgi:putative hydrolase of the HAD superfamily